MPPAASTRLTAGPAAARNDKLLWRQYHPTQGKTETGWTDNKRWGQTGQQYPHMQVAAFMQAGCTEAPGGQCRCGQRPAPKRGERVSRPGARYGRLKCGAAASWFPPGDPLWQGPGLGHTAHRRAKAQSAGAGRVALPVCPTVPGTAPLIC